MNELLLTPEQMANVYITKAKPAFIDADGHSDWRYESAFCEAQLTHCTPLIEKALRKKILKEIAKYRGDKVDVVKFEEHAWAYWIPDSVWQTLKKGEKQ